MRTKISPERISEIIDQLYSGVTLKRIFNSNTKEIREFYEHVGENLIDEQKYVAAQLARSELLADEIIEIADTEIDPQRARVMVDARKWYASKMQPKKYGDRIDLNISQPLNISLALDAAKSRSQRLMSDPTKAIESQPIDIIEVCKIPTIGSEPADVQSSPTSDLVSNLPDDIFT